MLLPRCLDKQHHLCRFCQLLQEVLLLPLLPCIIITTLNNNNNIDPLLQTILLPRCKDGPWNSLVSFVSLIILIHLACTRIHKIISHLFFHLRISRQGTSRWWLPTPSGSCNSSRRCTPQRREATGQAYCQPQVGMHISCTQEGSDRSTHE